MNHQHREPLVRFYQPFSKRDFSTSQEQYMGLPDGKGALILVVDDEEAIRSITRVSLEAFGYRVLTADNGVEACSLYAQHQSEIAVVLTDWKMPRMNGAATVQALREINPDVCVVAASGQVGELSGVQAHLSKPYEIDELLQTLGALLEGRARPASGLNA